MAVAGKCFCDFASHFCSQKLKLASLMPKAGSPDFATPLEVTLQKICHHHIFGWMALDFQMFHSDLVMEMSNDNVLTSLSRRMPSIALL